MVTKELGRRDRLLQESRHDVYRDRRKQAGHAVCFFCSAVYAKGRWTWARPPRHARQAVCPACRRTAERMPAGEIRLHGGFLAEHDREILGLVKHVERRERSARPLERIMTIRKVGGEILIETTGAHVAGTIGTSLERSYKGTLSRHYPDQDALLRVDWSRE